LAPQSAPATRNVHACHGVVHRASNCRTTAILGALQPRAGFVLTVCSSFRLHRGRVYSRTTINRVYLWFSNDVSPRRRCVGVYCLHALYLFACKAARSSERAVCFGFHANLCGRCGSLLLAQPWALISSAVHSGCMARLPYLRKRSGVEGSHGHNTLGNLWRWTFNYVIRYFGVVAANLYGLLLFLLFARQRKEMRTGYGRLLRHILCYCRATGAVRFCCWSVNNPELADIKPEDADTSNDPDPALLQSIPEEQSAESVNNPELPDIKPDDADASKDPDPALLSGGTVCRVCQQS
jgi:hypothetical protein